MSARDLRPKRSRVARIAYSVGTTTEAGLFQAPFRVTDKLGEAFGNIFILALV
jgi:hypothetical protein